MLTENIKKSIIERGKRIIKQRTITLGIDFSISLDPGIEIELILNTVYDIDLLNELCKCKAGIVEFFNQRYMVFTSWNPIIGNGDSITNRNIPVTFLLFERK